MNTCLVHMISNSDKHIVYFLLSVQEFSSLNIWKMNDNSNHGCLMKTYFCKVNRGWGGTNIMTWLTELYML